jgi:predicted MPP superfamily phosphohydrolase
LPAFVTWVFAMAITPEHRRRLRRFAARVLPLLGLLHAYVAWRLVTGMPPYPAAAWAGAVWAVASASLIPLGMFARFVVPSQRMADLLTWIGALFMGLFSSLLVLTALRDLLMVVVGRTVYADAYVVWSAQAVPLLAALVTLIGLINARRPARVVTVTVPLGKLSALLNGFTLVQLSDLHVGPTIKAGYVRAIVERVNQLNADLVVITGDVVDGSVAQLLADTAPLADLRARHGVCLVTGNHEYYSGATEWVEAFRGLGLRPLLNEHVVIDHDGAQLLVAGVTDYSAHVFDPAQQSDPIKALAGSPVGLPRVLLAHQPRTAPAAASAGFDLQLSGHTHGGQFWPWNLLVFLQQPYTAGLHRLGDLWVYTSRGTGYWGPPKRFGAPSEITCVRLVSARG